MSENALFIIVYLFWAGSSILLGMYVYEDNESFQVNLLASLIAAPMAFLWNLILAIGKLFKS